jgi:hypothetical protein
MQILVEGTIAPWLWNTHTSEWYQGSLTDIGLFASAGTSLNGMPIQILWGSEPTITAAITINGQTVMLGDAGSYSLSWGTVYPATSMSSDYQNITVANFNPFNNLPDNIAIDSFLPSAVPSAPYGLGGSLELIGPTASCNHYAGGMVGPSCQAALDGYFYVNSMTTVPGPIIGEGPVAAVTLLILALVFHRRIRSSLQIT